jgi:hypothetical protein
MSGCRPPVPPSVNRGEKLVSRAGGRCEPRVRWLFLHFLSRSWPADCVRTAMEENGGSARHANTRARQSKVFDRRCTQIQSLICVHPRASAVDFSCSPTVRQNVGVYFMVEGRRAAEVASNPAGLHRDRRNAGFPPCGANDRCYFHGRKSKGHGAWCVPLMVRSWRQGERYRREAHGVPSGTNLSYLSASAASRLCCC